MKTLAVLALGICCLASAVHAADKNPPAIPTGLQWLQSSGQEREEGLLAALLSVKSAGIEMKGRFLDYHEALGRHLLRHPELNASPLTDVLADYLYETDPASRPVLDKLRRL